MKLSTFDKIKRKIKLIYALPNYKKLLNKINHNSDGKRAILIGTPIHGNLGDHLIAKEAIKYLSKFDFKEIIEVPEIFYELYYKNINISTNDIIFISGGGWMGSLYYDELVIEDIIKRWKNNTIIILPQTVSFNGGKYTTKEKLSKILNNHNKLILTVRDEKSYNLCLNELRIKRDKIFLLPDMALNGLKNINSIIKTDKSIILSIRNDREKNNTICFSSIVEQLKEEKYKIINSSSVIDKKVIKIKDREKWILKKIKEYSQSSIVITDRLHSMVFALLSGTKCIAIDNSTHKVLGVYKKWLKNQKAIWVINKDETLSPTFIEEVRLSRYIPIDVDYSDYFERLDKIIEEAVI